MRIGGTGALGTSVAGPNARIGMNLHNVEGYTTHIGSVANPGDAANVLVGRDSVVNAALAVDLEYYSLAMIEYIPRKT